ncbi:DUF2787 domain-containing protein [Salmonella enterica subsp. enterica]|nr:DUF2787 domain-containing protein [Salmonella enterica subsp. enterica]
MILKYKMVIHQPNIVLPLSSVFIDMLQQELSLPPKTSTLSGVTLTFRDAKRSGKNDGYHPVNIRLVCVDKEWYFDSLVDFRYVQRPYPEMEKEFDVSWSLGYVWHYIMGQVSIEMWDSLFEIWQRNFIRYWENNKYVVTSLWDK